MFAMAEYGVVYDKDALMLRLEAVEQVSCDAPDSTFMQGPRLTPISREINIGSRQESSMTIIYVLPGLR